MIEKFPMTAEGLKKLREELESLGKLNTSR